MCVQKYRYQDWKENVKCIDIDIDKWQGLGGASNPPKESQLVRSTFPGTSSGAIGCIILSPSSCRGNLHRTIKAIAGVFQEMNRWEAKYARSGSDSDLWLCDDWFAESALLIQWSAWQRTKPIFKKNEAEAKDILDQRKKTIPRMFLLSISWYVWDYATKTT